ncbi:E3 SUMO-protein ligase RanBP2-like isoform X2 [Ambystoma mexicanum]|uniref:E3 SUMO-protein ligase RanBP2-like isoform X2 n=1 Tax=Ambystoma mexicanum TaxID=8296 RepID=UPI0037E7065F
MRRNKADVERYIASVQSASPSTREKSMKGFFFAKLYFEAKEYELAKRYISSYLNVQERDPKAHKFLGQLYEIEDNVDKAVGCYKRSVELNPAQKDLVLKIAELLCDQNVDDGKIQYWVERASKLFPGSPAVYKLKEKLLNVKGKAGWNQLFDLIQSELYARPDDVYVNIRLVELYRVDKRFEEAVNHCLNAEKKGTMRTSLEWCSCVVTILKDYIESLQGVGSDKSMWRSLNKELLLAQCNLMLLTLSTRDVQESRRTFQSFDHALQLLKPHASGTDDLSAAFQEVRGHFYMHAGTLLLKMAQESEAQWRAVTEPAALCYLIAFQVPKPKNKSIKRDENNQDVLEMLACDRQSQSGHMLLNLSQNQQEFCRVVVETFANKSGQTALFEVLFENEAMMEQSFLGSDDFRSVECSDPELAELARCDNGAIRLHNGSLNHLTWLGLQWQDLDSLPTIRKWLKQLFPRLPQETSRLDTNAPESICLLDLEVFLLGVIFTSHLQLQDHFNVHYSSHQPRCLPMAVCKPLCTERHRSWWDAVYNLIHKKAQPGTSAKLRLLVQHELTTLRALEKHGLQPSLVIHLARSLHKTGSCLNSFYDQREYMGRCVYYWKKVLPLLEIIKRKRSIPEPIDPLFKHFHSQDIQVPEVREYEEEAQIAFASLNVVDGKIEDAIQTFDRINNVVAYWNLALIFQRKAEEIENDALSPEEQEECKNCLKKCREYLLKIIEESFDSTTVGEKLPVPIESVKEMLDSVMQELGEYCGEESPVFNNDSSQISSEIKHSTPSPSKFTLSPSKGFKLSPKTPPRWAEDQKSILQMLCQRVEALKNEVEELKSNNSNANLSPHRWPSDSFAPEPIADNYHGAQSFHGAPLTVSTSGPAAYYNQSPGYNSQYPLRTTAGVAPSKTPVYGMNRLAPQQHMYGYQQQLHTPPLQNPSSCVFTPEIYGPTMRFEPPAPGLLSPRGDDYYHFSAPPTSANPPLPEPGYFTKPSMGPPVTDSKLVEFGKTHFGQNLQTNATKFSPFIPSGQGTPSSFKFNSNFKSNDGDFTFSPPQIVPPSSSSTFTGSESLFGLLTSDTTFQDGYAGQGQTTDQINHFNFGSKSLSDQCFTETITPNQSKTPSFFGKGDQPFTFQDPGKLVFGTPNVELVADRSHESEGGSILGAADDDGPHFEPVVPLPDKVEVKTGEEDEDELFSNRAKLFRFDTELKEWKERGIGIVKILRHIKSGKLRLLMRREQVLKICANHYINADMTLKPNAGSDKSYVWHALDYADETAKPEQLAIRFKTPEEATLFKQKFEEAQQILKELAAGDSQSQQSARTSQEVPSKETKDTGMFSSGSSSLALQFARKPGEWDCDVCLIRNSPTATVCVSCQTTAPHAISKVPPPVAVCKTTTLSLPTLPTFSFSKETIDSPCSGFSEHLKKKKGQWDCSVCSVPNESTAKICIACRAPYPSSVLEAGQQASTNKIALGNLSCSVKSDFGSRFSRKEGQWDCNVCLVRNEAISASCVSCLTPKPQAGPASAVTFPSVSNFKFGSSTETSTLKPSGFGAQFLKKEGQWDCKTCLVRNEGSLASCASCQTPNPCAKAGTPAFTFGLKSNFSEPAGGQTGTGFKSAFSESSFKFGNADQGVTPSSFKFQIPSSTSESKPVKEGFSFSMPILAGGFKFGSQEPTKIDSKEDTANKSSASFPKDCVKEMTKPFQNEASVQSEGGSKKNGEIFFGPKGNSFTFADLAKSSPNKEFEFGKKDPDFKGFSRAGEKLFSSTNILVPQFTSPVEQERSDELYQTEDCDDIHFEPVVQLPEKVELVTGEEEETVLYSQRVKLFRFDADASQWKERGVGNLKILRNEENGKLRMLMRREQVLKVCANHWITTTMNLKSLSGSDRAWMWLASDFADGDAKLEQLAAKFKTPEQAEEFRIKFEECQMLLLDIPLQTPHKLMDTGRSAQLIQKAEEMKSGLKDLKTFLTDEKMMRPEEDSRNVSSVSNTSGLVIKPHAESTGPTLEWDNYDLREEALDGNLDNSVYASSLASSPEKTNLFRFGDSAAGFNFSFQPALSPSKSPTKLNQSRVSVGTDDESDITQEEEKDGQYFEPVVPLPDLVEVSSGEENEQIVFCHRAKLYRFDKDANQWKERGIGDIKILQNYDTKSVRVLMRRDQVLKLCANHRITADLDLKPMIGTERSWVWTAHDFSEGEGKMEMFAVRFKLQDVADSFKQIFEEAKNAQERDTLLTPLSSRGNTPRVSPCGKLAVAVLEETTRERTDLESTDNTPDQSDLSSSSATPVKAVVSPPKFVFGSDSVKNIFSCEKPTTFTFGSTLASGSLFGFSYTPSKNNSEKERESSVSQDTTVKRLDFKTKDQSHEISSTDLNKMAGSALASSTVKGSPQRDDLKMPTKAGIQKEADSTDDVIFVSELTPTPEQKALAERLRLPVTFFCYKNRPDYTSDDEPDDEDFETAVKKLNGRLYPEDHYVCTTSQGSVTDPASTESQECVLVWEKRPTPEEKAKAESLKLPLTFFCGVNSDTDEDKEPLEDFETEVRRVQSSDKSPHTEVTSSSEAGSTRKVGASVLSSVKSEKEPDSTTESTLKQQTISKSDDLPIDLSIKAEQSSPDSTSQGLKDFDLFGFSSSTGQSFADLASNNSGDFAFGCTDANFTWQNSGEVLFKSVTSKREDEDGNDDEAVQNEDIHFEPIVSLPEVEVKSGEEDEEILFKERAKLYRWDRDLNQWKERGVGEIKILFHQEKKYYRVLMRRDQVLKVCANHVIAKSMDIQPLSTSNNALVWMATDYSEGEGKVEQLSARFKTPELMNSFQKRFQECQQNLPELEDVS